MDRYYLYNVVAKAIINESAKVDYSNTPMKAVAESFLDPFTTDEDIEILVNMHTELCNVLFVELENHFHNKYKPVVDIIGEFEVNLEYEKYAIVELTYNEHEREYKSAIRSVIAKMLGAVVGGYADDRQYMGLHEVLDLMVDRL